MDALWPILWQSVLLPAGIMLLGVGLAVLWQRWPWAWQSVLILAFAAAAVAVDVASRGGLEWWPADVTRRPGWLALVGLLIVPFVLTRWGKSALMLGLLAVGVLGLSQIIPMSDPRNQYLIALLGAWSLMSVYWLSAMDASSELPAMEFAMSFGCIALAVVILLHHSASLAQQAMGTGSAWLIMSLSSWIGPFRQKAANLVGLFFFCSWTLASQQFSELPGHLALLLLLTPLFPLAAAVSLQTTPRWSRVSAMCLATLLPFLAAVVALHFQNRTEPVNEEPAPYRRYM